MNKKLIAPVVVAIILAALFVAYMCLWAVLPIPTALKAVFIIALLGCIGVTIYVTIERIKEIRSGEEDDLSQY